MNPHGEHPVLPSALMASVWRNRALILQLAKRDVIGRYKGSVLGIFWSLLTPLFMLGVFTFVFGTIFQTRWGSGQDATSKGELALVLFAGLIVFQLFSEVVTRAPTLVLSHANYVKKVIFPLEILPLVVLISALFHAAVSFVVLLASMFAIMEYVPATALLLPLVIAPFVLLILGLTWFLASLGVYLRDISQVLGTLITALMFLSPIFYSSSALPTWLRPYIVFNPVAIPVEQVRNVLIWGRVPDWMALGTYAIVAVLVAMLGYVWFQKTRKGFADVL